MLSELWENIEILWESYRAHKTDAVTAYESNTIQQFYSNRFVLAKDRFPVLQERFIRLCKKAELKHIPKFVVVDDPSINASNIRTGTIVVTTTAMNKLSDAQLDVLLAHEITHQFQRNARIAMWFILPITELAAGIGSALIASHSKFINNKKIWGVVGIYEAASRLTHQLLQGPREAFYRFLESDADRGSLIISNDLEAAIGQVETNEAHIAALKAESEKGTTLARTRKKKEGFDPHKLANERISELKRFKAEIDSGEIDRTRVSRLQ